jgi:DNA-binding NarL/FixJ family response regulator
VIGDGGSEAGQLEAGLDGASGGVLRVAGRAGDRRAGADLVRRRRPDVAVVDLAGLPAAPSEAADTIRELHAASPSTRLLAVAGHADADLAVATLNAGALGFVVRPADLRDLVAPVMTVASGHTVVPRDLLSGLVGSSLPCDTGLLDALTPEYADLWRMVADGLETTQIAERLYVSERTAKRMVAFLLRRLGVANRIQAAALAGQAGLLDDVGAPS